MLLLLLLVSISFHFVEIKDEEIFFICGRNRSVYTGVLAGNEGAERTEATPDNETAAEMGPPPSISTRESNIFLIPDSACGQLRE
uniref:Secreted protein n=1 Tax=Triticum urartu TaxID=4572 RepID=A0A8R7V299_TRIUA